MIVAAAHRGQGLARTVVAEALAEGARIGRDYALLFCLEDRSGLYRKLDFSVLDSPLTVLQPQRYRRPAPARDVASAGGHAGVAAGRRRAPEPPVLRGR